MKKLKILFSILLCSVLVLAGCGETSLQFDGAYWDDTPSGFSKITEVSTYNVTLEDHTPLNSTVVSNEYVKMVIDSGTYVTTLSYDSSTSSNVYTYTTTLNVSGKYVVFNTEEQSFSDSVTVEAKFLPLSNGFKPLSVKKTSPCTTLLMVDNQGFYTTKFNYEYTIDYEDSTAKTVYKAKSLEEGAEFETTENKFEKYNKKAYVDNDLILLTMRAFNFSDNFVQNFSTIDVVTQKLTNMTAYTGKTLTKVSFDNSFLYNGQEKPFDMGSRLILSINEDFTGAIIENYYSPEGLNPYHHALLKSYSALNDNLGYLCYTLKSVEYN